jgi:uncharacterized membrane protein YeaQ/YmgE (transglycosylase-associated protein family)
MGVRGSPYQTGDQKGLEENMSVILFLIFGLIVGALARLIVPGREPGGWLTSLVVGVAGAFLGGFLGRVFGLYTHDVTTGGFVMSLIGAVILVAIYQAISRRRTLP